MAVDDVSIWKREDVVVVEEKSIMEGELADVVR